MVSDVRKMEAENKNVNIHVLFNDADLPYLSPYINVLQNLKLKMKPGYDYTFSATCISSNGETRHLAQPRTFLAWLDYIKQSISSKRKNEQEEQSSFYGFGGAIKQISRYDDESRFSNNVFVILGSKQTLSLHEQQLSWLDNPTGKASVYPDRQSIRHFLSGLPIAGQIHSGQPFYEIHRPYIQLYRRQSDW